ncbi:MULTISPECIES: TPM domain-containing protein [unclassified Sphingomonas]|uniref:TPM domain-containing protein n=1 Tax=unclassified Sphingomonas TaxID=196159 RepID=UPI000AC6D787|nr:MULTISPECIES: TPM domain-containing protein [unclassified Sphingomonas]
MLLAGCGTAGSGPTSAASPTLPALTGRVVDAADLLPTDKEALLDRMLRTTERATRGQFVVVTLPTLNGRKIEDVGMELGRTWKIGRADVDDGVMLIVAPNERQVRIEAGYGLEGVLRDEEAKAITTDTIISRIRSGNMPGAILAGSAAIIREINVPGATP